MEYASAEYTDMHFIYGVATSMVEAKRLYAASFQNHRVSSDKLFSWLPEYIVD